MRAFILLAGLSAGCNIAPLIEGSAPPEYGVTAIPALKVACVQAADRWERASGLRLSCTTGRPMVYGDPANICAAASTSYDRVRIRDHETGQCIRGGRSHDTFPDTPEQLAASVAHELGHVLHGTDVPSHAAGGLMGVRSGDSRITAETLEWLCAAAPCTAFEPEAE